MTLGERIGNKRRAAGLSQEELGNILGVTRQSIYKWENDQAVPELDNLFYVTFPNYSILSGKSISEQPNSLFAINKWRE